MLLILIACTGPEGEEDPGLPSPIGQGDGSPGSVSWTLILDDGDRLTDPRDLAFDEEGRLWVANREDDRTFIVSDPGTSEQDKERVLDDRNGHFMEETGALSFDGNGQFGSCGEGLNTYNGMAEGNGYTGPVLWSTSLDIFGEVDPIGLGSHLDMLHESPNCVGIAWERDNVYWVFDGENGDIVRYDFQGDHGPGMDDHSDGIIDRVTGVSVEFEAGVPGHMAIDPETGILYVADTGNDRVIWIDTATGEEGDRLRSIDAGVEHNELDDVESGELIAEIDTPGALALGVGHLFVAEWSTGVIYEYDLDGTELRSLDTGLGAEAITGIEIGPDGKLWVLDNAGVTVSRIDP